MRCHEVDYQILGTDMQAIEVELDPSETVIAEAGAMAPPLIRNAEARRVFLAGQGLSRPPRRKLTAAGLVREVIVDRAKIFYDSNTREHYHLFDVEAGTLTDVDADAIAITGLPGQRDGVVIEAVDLIVRVRSRSR